MAQRECPTCGELFEPRRTAQRFCRRNCGRWHGHTAIQERLSARPPADEREAYLAGLIATDGYVERRRGRDAPTGISIKMAPVAAPLLGAIADYYGRRLCHRSNGQVVLSFVDVPVVWKTALPSLSAEFEVAYVRGLLDGDGCISGAHSNGHFYPYVSLAYNPQREAWVGDFYTRFLRKRCIGFRELEDRPTVIQIRSWSANARQIAAVVYDGPVWAHPVKLERARRILQGKTFPRLPAWS